jgi:hypothetical protein
MNRWVNWVYFSFMISPIGFDSTHPACLAGWYLSVFVHIE